MVQLNTRGDQFDHVMIETTGMADPRPIIGVFNGSDLQDYMRLDGVVTVVDAKNVERHLDDKSGEAEGAVNEALQQIAYADRIILNKTDLVSTTPHYWPLPSANPRRLFLGLAFDHLEPFRLLPQPSTVLWTQGLLFVKLHAILTETQCIGAGSS